MLICWVIWIHENRNHCHVTDKHQKQCRILITTKRDFKSELHLSHRIAVECFFLELET